MKTSKHNILNANQAVANIAFKTNEVIPIYPITPASEMSELVEQWSAQYKQNCFGSIPNVFQMQSEAGVAGAMHGALQTGSLSTTFTASQGLLLMLPNMYKMAGELIPNVIHVATRSIATHALSVFGDHSDIMAVRQSGYAMLGSASVQEAQDFALISQVATLQSKIPFLHFFDGFRTSHEWSKIETISDKIIQFMMNKNDIQLHKQRALNPNNPIIRGTSQGADVFFQSREATNSFYNACPDIVQNTMETFYQLTGRQYQLFDYVGHPEAEYIIISMASSTETIEKSIKYLNQKKEKLGLIKVRLYRPFSTKHLLKALPKTCKSIAVLDRTKEPGSSGEPLYLDVNQALSEAYQTNKIVALPRIIGGRYGLSSKEFTPSMVNAIFHNLKQEQPKNHFTIGINDDVTNLSLHIPESTLIPNSDYQAVFYENKHRHIGENFKNTLNLIGKNTDTYVQGYIECDYKKSNSRSVSHLRISSKSIKAPYLIENADFIACENPSFIENDNPLDILKPKGTLLVSTELSTKGLWQSLSTEKQSQIIEKDITLYTINIKEIEANKALKSTNISVLQACFFSLNTGFNRSELNVLVNEFIYKVDTSNIEKTTESNNREDYNTYAETLLGKLLANKGYELPVSLMPKDGTYPTNTSIHNIIERNDYLPEWHPNACTQCGACSMACPQAALRIKAFDNAYLNEAPNNFKHIASQDFDLLSYTIQINSNQCNGCNNCVDACPAKALTLVDKQSVKKKELKNWNYFENIPEFDRTKIDVTKVSQQQLQEPLFKYAAGVDGCGEAPYLKLISQLFGDRLLIANATGASSIFGGALPTTPWSKNKDGRGPAWCNSLFEDNAEFGLGFRLSLNQQEKQARFLLEKLAPHLGYDIVFDILNTDQKNESEIKQQRLRIKALNKKLESINSWESNQLMSISDALVKKSVWIVGGDGWAYDIGFGGIDHILASGENVNILVLDNEVYDNTGAQASKATPFGAQAKFAFSGKQKQKKDLGLLAMTYSNVYVASVALGANQEQTLKAFHEAESFEGPSIIVAYCHSESHGIDMKKPSQHHKAAVNSGQWLLYRHDPRNIEKEVPVLRLDSESPSIAIEDYLLRESRFKKLFENDKETCREILNDYQERILSRYQAYLNMASKQEHTKPILHP